MKFQFSILRHKNHMELEDVETYTSEEIQGIYSLLDMGKVHVHAELTLEGEIAHIEFHIQTKLYLECAYTLEKVDYPLDFIEELDFSSSDLYENDENIVFVKGDVIDLHPYILGLIITEIPMKVVKKGAKLPKGGKGYEVITEEEYYKKKEESVDSRFSALDYWNDDEE